MRTATVANPPRRFRQAYRKDTKLPDRLLQRSDVGQVVLLGHQEVVVTEPLDRLHEATLDLLDAIGR